MGGMRRALFEESSSDERKERKPGMKRRGLAGPGAKQGNEQKPGAKKPFSPRVDIFESPTSYTVNVALPGAKRENIQLVWRCKRGVLVVKGRILRKTEDIKQSHTIAQRERAAGTFERRIALKFDSAADFKPASIAANLEDGVLRVDLSKEKTEKSFDGPWKINF
jgi:HSP20 family protein